MTNWYRAKNKFSSTLSASISDTATTISIKSGDGAKLGTVNTSNPVILRIDGEVLKCTGRTNDSLTVVRGFDSSTPSVHVSGSVISLNIEADQIQQIQDGIDVIEASTAGANGVLEALARAFSVFYGGNGIPRDANNSLCKVSIDSGLYLTVNAGVGNCDDTFFYLDASSISIPVETGSYRYDLIQLGIDADHKAIISRKTGTTSAPPTADSGHISLASVRIEIGQSELTEEDIADLRPLV